MLHRIGLVLGSSVCTLIASLAVVPSAVSAQETPNADGQRNTERAKPTPAQYSAPLPVFEADGKKFSVAGVGKGSGGKAPAQLMPTTRPPRPDSKAEITQQAVSPSGDRLSINGLRRPRYDSSRASIDCTYTDAVWTGEGFVYCAWISVWDSQLGTNVAPRNNWESDTTWDACGNVVLQGSTYNHGSSSGHFTGLAGSQLYTVPRVASKCYGDWTVEYTFTQVFSNGQTLTDTFVTTFKVYESRAAYLADLNPQPTPTGGAVGPEEQLGGCGSTESTHAQATDYPVDTATGNFWHTFTDVTIPGRGMPIELTRTYNSATADLDGPFGYGWSDRYGAFLEIAAGQVVVHQCNGSQVTFVQDETGGWTAPPRVFAELRQRADGTWSFIRGAHQSFSFDTQGRLTEIVDLNGYATTVSYPNPSTRLVTDPAGRTLTFTLTDGRVTSVTDSTTPTRGLTYQYDAAGDLTQVTDVGGGRWKFTYDTAHRMLSMQSPGQNGPTEPGIVNEYDPQGRIATQTDQLGRTTSFDYTSVPDATQVTDPKGNATLFRYQDGLLVYETRGYGTSESTDWLYRYDPDTLGRTLVVDGAGRQWRADYDDAGNLTSAWHISGYQTSFTYNRLRQVTSITEPRFVGGTAIVRTFTYDSAGNLRSESAPLLSSTGAVTATSTTTYRYEDPAHPGDLTSIVDPNGNTTSYTYDQFGNLTALIQAPTPENPDGNRTTFGYDADRGWITSVVAPRGNLPGANPANHTTTIDYDDYGRPTLTRDPLWDSATPNRHRVVRHYDADGNLDSITDGENHTTAFEHNAAHELVKVTRPDGTTLQSTYWPDGRLRAQVDGAGQTTSYDYNPLGHLVAVTDPLNRTTRYTLDGTGNVTSETNPEGRVTYVDYDSVGRVSKIRYNSSSTPNVSSITYDANGQRTQMTDGTGTTTWNYDSLHRLVSTTDGAGNTVAYEWDLGGRLTKIHYPGGRGSVSYTYDAADRMRQLEDFADRVTTFGYDANSNLTDTTYPNGTRTTRDVDPAGQLLGIQHTATTQPDPLLADFDYTRDGAGRVTTVTSTGVPSDTHSFSRDLADRLTGVDDNTFGYDAADNLTRLLDGTVQDYDAANQLTSTTPAPISHVGTNHVSGNASTLTLPLPAGSSDRDQAILAITLPNGQSVSTPTGYTLIDSVRSGTTNSDAKVMLFRRTLGAGDTAITLAVKGKFDKSAAVAVYRNVHPSQPVDSYAGTGTNGTTVTVGSLTATRAGTRLAWVGGATGTAGAWTAPADMTTRVQGNSATTDIAIADQTLQTSGPSGSRTATHSPATRLAAALIALRPAGRSFTYDPQGNRTTVTTAAGATVPHTYDQANRLIGYGTNTTYEYDGDGLRRSKTVTGARTQFTWDGARGLPLLLSEGSTSYVYGPEGLPLERIQGDGTATFYHHDQLGSTRKLTDLAGQTVASYSYDPYGNLTGSTGTDPNPFKFAGEYTDPETGYLYLRARYLDPGTGQFLTRDPLTSLSRQPYAYAGNDPTTNIDPTGMICLPCLIGIGMATGAAIDAGMQVIGNVINGCDLFAINGGSVATSAAIGGLSGGIGGAVLRTGLASAAAKAVVPPANSGIYVVNSANGVYVGQSGNMTSRLAQHVRSGKFTQAEVDAAARQGVPGGRTQREIAEQLMLDRIGRVGDPGILNRLNPIGPRRFPLMPNQPYVR